MGGRLSDFWPTAFARRCTARWATLKRDFEVALSATLGEVAQLLKRFQVPPYW